MKKTRFTEPQIMAVLRESESGVAVPAVCRTHGISTIGPNVKRLCEMPHVDRGAAGHLHLLDCVDNQLQGDAEPIGGMRPAQKLELAA